MKLCTPGTVTPTDTCAPMRLYFVKRTGDCNYDEYDSAVVAAATAVAAALTCPCDEDYHPEVLPDHWVPPRDVEVRYLGLAEPGVGAGVICASFKAG